jgi:hypothetical protein
MVARRQESRLNTIGQPAAFAYLYLSPLPFLDVFKAQTSSHRSIWCQRGLGGI